MFNGKEKAFDPSGGIARNEAHIPSSIRLLRILIYDQAKTVNVLFSVGLNQKLNPKVAKPSALHPGSIRSNLQKYVRLK
jgi:hypothetical protein